MKLIGTIEGKRRRTKLAVDDAVPSGFWRITRNQSGDVFVYASSSSWGAHAAVNLAAACRPAGVP